MNNNVEQQIFDSINKAHRVLIAIPQSPNGDAVGAGLALMSFLKKLEKEPELISAAEDLGAFQFLPQSKEIQKTLKVFQSFVISVKTARAQLDELSYETKPGSVDIFLKPKDGKFAPEDVSFRSARFPYDLIITLDAPSLEHLGKIYEENTDMFFETPIINIDHHPANELYGEINLVELTATSTSEILTTIIENFEEGLIDAAIATQLLIGIVVETNSFQNVKTTPQSFLKASSLIGRGGDHQGIIRELYKTKNISLLKLWGRALARIKDIKHLNLAYSVININDLTKSGSGAQDVLGVMKELVANLAGRKIILLLAELSPQDIIGYFYLHPSLKSQVISAAIGGQMLNGSLGMFRLKGKELPEGETEVLSKLEKIKDQIAV